MTVLAPGLEAPVGEPVGDWHPTRYTAPLVAGEDFRTEGDKLLRFAARYWSIPDAEALALDEWQRWLIRHVLEVYPDDWPVVELRGQLRYRQVVISMGRQNGKSVLGALFAIYLLALHVRGPRVIGLASIDRQARIVYDRVKYAIEREPALAAALKTTLTRGITRRDGSGIYQTLPAVEDSAQGEPASGVLYDELHLGLAALWDAMVIAQSARPNALMVGLTTAGDDNSALLLRLYDEGEAAIAGNDERFGFFLWEAADDELTEANVIAANPAVACGRKPLALVMNDARKMADDHRPNKEGLTGPQRVKRYILNRFLEGSARAWANTEAWKATAQGAVMHAGGVVYSLDRTRDWEWASIEATSRAGDRYRTELVASLAEADHDRLVAACKALAGHRPGVPAVFAMPADTLGKVADTLKEAGLEAWKLGSTEMASAAQHGKAVIGRGLVDHPGDALLRRQMSRAVPRHTGDGWRLSRSLSSEPIDGVVALVAGLYVAGVRQDLEESGPPIY